MTKIFFIIFFLWSCASIQVGRSVEEVLSLPDPPSFPILNYNNLIKGCINNEDLKKLSDFKIDYIAYSKKMIAFKKIDTK